MNMKLFPQWVSQVLVDHMFCSCAVRHRHIIGILSKPKYGSAELENKYITN
jgi:hypothetical protein